MTPTEGPTRLDRASELTLVLLAAVLLSPLLLILGVALAQAKRLLTSSPPTRGHA